MALLFFLNYLGSNYLFFLKLPINRSELFFLKSKPNPLQKLFTLWGKSCMCANGQATRWANVVLKTKSHTVVKLLWFFLLLSLTPAIAQKKYSLNITGFSNQNKISYNKAFTDSLQVIKQVDSVVTIVKLNGYFNCAINSYEWKNQNLNLNLNTGTAYKFVSISNGNINPNAYNLKKAHKNQVWNIAELKDIYSSVLKWYDNNGYPFAQVWLDSLAFNQNNITAKLFCEANNKFTIDSVLILGNAKLSLNFLYAALDLKPGDIYQENKIVLIDKRLKSLNIITVEKNTEIIFDDYKTKLHLYINQKNANQFDGIIGFLPATNGNKLQFTGDFKLKLQNTLKRGELFDLNYRGLPNQTQQLITKINYPYLFVSKIGLDLDFQLFKKDTSFLNLNTKLGFSYAFTPEKLVNVFVENYKGNLISSVDNTKTGILPSFTNIATTYYGIGTILEKTDNSLLPQKGYKLIFAASVGQRKLIKSQNFNPDEFPNTIKNTTQYKLNMDLNYYLKFTPKFGLYARNQAAILSGTNIFENEAYRIGGFKILRGFNEQSILVSSYIVQSLETRYFIEKNSFLFTFYDQGFVKQSFSTGLKTDIPAGFGAGINFETKLGFMSLMYALGKQQNNPLNLRTGKIHFGLVSYF